MEQQGEIVAHETYLKMTDFEKFMVEGHNLEWSPEPCIDTGKENEGGYEDTSDPPLWALALVAAGVAVTVASVSVFVWSLCGTCKSGSNS